MNFNDLEKSIAELNGSLEGLNHWMVFFTLLVVVGLGLEYFAPVKKLLTEKPFNPKLLAAAVGGILVTIGVFGELAVEVPVGIQEAQLRFKDDAYVAQLKDATESARRDTELARKEAQLARKETQLASKETEAAKLAVAVANQRAGEAKTIAEREHIERLRLERQLSPRRLTGDQTASIVKVLGDKPGSEIIVTSAVFDLESSDYADDFVNAFKAAGWTASPNKTRLNHVRGVTLGSVGGEELNGMSRVRAALKTIGVLFRDVKLSLDDHTIANGYRRGIIYLQVEHK